MTTTVTSNDKGIWGPDGDPAEAVRTLAAALGVSLGGTVSEEDYLVAVAEKDAAMTELRGLRQGFDAQEREVERLRLTVADLTQQRDELLQRVHDMEDTVDEACANLARLVKR